MTLPALLARGSGLVVRLRATAERRLRRQRGWWARRPGFTDVVVAVVYAVLATALFLYAEVVDLLLDPRATILPSVILIASIAAVLLRRRWPWAMALVVLALAALSRFDAVGIDVLAIPIMTFTLAVHRNALASLAYAMLTAVTSAMVLVLPWISTGTGAEEVTLTAVVLLAAVLVGLFAGLAVRGRRLYVGALVDQAASLERERQMVAELSAERERLRIAREMHDIVSHTLTVVVTLADGAVAATDVSDAREAMAASASAARGALTNLRRLLGTLREDHDAAYAPQIDDQSVAETVQQFTQAGLPVTLDVRGEPMGDAVLALAVLRVVQEGLTNALRYSESPESVDVSVHYRSDGMEVQVRNDGAVPEAASVGAGQGLLGVRERVGLLGGEVWAGPVGDRGWALQAWIPVMAPGAGETR